MTSEAADVGVEADQPTVTAAAPKKRRELNWRPWVWMAPALILLGVFLLYPMLNTIRISFYRGSIINPTSEFIGIDNYSRLLTNDPAFIKYGLPPWSAVFNSALWVVLFTTGVIAFGLIVAVFSDKVRYERLSKAIIFLPLVISFTAASVIFRQVYATDPDIGIVNAFLGLFGLGPVAWLGQPNTVNFAIIVAAIWVWTSLAMVILSAAYKALPEDVHEAASVDGANAWESFWKVSFPMLRPAIIVVAVTMIINALKAIDLVLVMTQGGPQASSRIIGFTVFWEIFTNNKAGYGSAAAVILLILMIPLMWWQLRIIRSEEAR